MQDAGAQQRLPLPSTDPKFARRGSLFAASESAQVNPQGTRGMPSQFVQMIPYVFTAIALAGVVRKSTPPAALGKAE